MSSSQLTNSYIFQRGRLNHQPYTVYIYILSPFFIGKPSINGPHTYIYIYIHHGTYGFCHLMVGHRWMFRCRWEDPLGRSEESSNNFPKRACERWGTNWRFHSFSFRVFAFSLEGYKTTRLVGLDRCCHLPFFFPLSSMFSAADLEVGISPEIWCRIWRHRRDAVGPTVAWIPSGNLT